MTESVRSRLSAVLGALFVVAVVFVTVVLVAPGVLGAEASYVVLSGSMAPTIQAGDVVVVSAADIEDIGVGDVLTYTDAGSTQADSRSSLVTHRVIEITRENGDVRFVTQGDANDDPDPSPVRPSQVVGVVWFHLPLVGHLVLFAGSQYGIVLFVIVPGLLLVASELRSLYNDALVDDEADDPTADGVDRRAEEQPQGGR